MNMITKLKRNHFLKKAKKKSKELDTMIDLGLTFIMLSSETKIKEGTGPDEEFRNMVKEIGKMIIDKEELDEKLNI